MGRPCLSFPVARGCQTCSLGRFFQGAWAGRWSPLPTLWHYTTAPKESGAELRVQGEQGVPASAGSNRTADPVLG